MRSGAQLKWTKLTKDGTNHSTDSTLSENYIFHILAVSKQEIVVRLIEKTTRDLFEMVIDKFPGLCFRHDGGIGVRLQTL